MVGRWLAGRESTDRLHSWVVFREGDCDYLLETVRRKRSEMLRPLAEAKADYIPHLSVRGDLTRRVYSGLFAWLHSRRQERKERRRATTVELRSANGS